MQVEACIRCPFHNTCTIPIMGGGDPRSPILIISDTIRQADDEESRIFAGRAGAKIDNMLTEADIPPERVYKTPLVRCYSGREAKFSEFRAYKRCRYHTHDLLKIMRPRVVVLAGLKPLLWMIIRLTAEKLDETTFYKWVGKAVRLKEIWKDTKFFIIESPAQLARRRNPENERKSIEILTTMRAYVSAQQKGEALVLDMVDLKTRRKGTAQQMKFSFTATDEPKPQEH